MLVTALHLVLGGLDPEPTTFNDSIMSIDGVHFWAPTTTEEENNLNFCDCPPKNTTIFLAVYLLRQSNFFQSWMKRMKISIENFERKQYGGY